MASTKWKRKSGKCVVFDIYIKISATGEKFLLENVNAEMKIRELKCYAELVTGIPSNLQRLHYLDEGDMMDDTELRHNDVVSGATINLKIWRMWEKLVAAVALGSVNDVFKEGIVTKNDKKSTDPTIFNNKLLLSKERSAVALYIASHRGHNHLLRTLVDEADADVNMKTPFGRTPLHVAASQGHSSTIDLMLEKGACMDVNDAQGKTPLMIASQCGFKDTERHLFLFQWQTRAAKIKSRKRNDTLMMHQQFDSSFPTHLRGNYGQRYYCATLPPGEFAGTSLSAPRRKPKEANGMKQTALPPIRDPQTLEADKQNKGKYSAKGSETQKEQISHGSGHSQDEKTIQNGSLEQTKNQDSKMSNKSLRSATSSRSAGSHKTFEEWKEEKKIQKNKERQSHTLRTQMKKEEEQKRSKSKRKVEDLKTSKDFTRDQSNSSNRTVLDRLEAEEQSYEPSWDYSSLPNREYRRISTIREGANENYDYLRFSFDLWPRRIPSDAVS